MRTKVKKLPKWGQDAPRAASMKVHLPDAHPVPRTEWKQPGRRFGPSPLGPDTPKANKLTDRDGNPRIAPLTADQRMANYGRTRRGRQFLTGRQERRLTHKANHANAPFGKES